MNRVIVALSSLLVFLAAAALMLSPGQRPAEASIGTWIGVINCTGEDVTVCYYDKTDLVVGVDASSAGLKNGNYTRGGCNTKGACKVRVFKGSNTNKCVDLGRNDSNYIVPGTPTVSVGAYWLAKVDGKVSWVRASDDSKWVNRSENQTCARLQIGDKCALSSECRSGHCMNSICCDAYCLGRCQSCAGDWSGAVKGACQQKPYGASDSACKDGLVCDGKGGCVTYRPRPGPR